MEHKTEGTTVRQKDGSLSIPGAQPGPLPAAPDEGPDTTTHRGRKSRNETGAPNPDAAASGGPSGREEK